MARETSMKKAQKKLVERGWMIKTPSGLIGRVGHRKKYAIMMFEESGSMAWWYAKKQGYRCVRVKIVAE